MFGTNNIIDKLIGKSEEAKTMYIFSKTSFKIITTVQ